MRIPNYGNLIQLVGILVGAINLFTSCHDSTVLDPQPEPITPAEVRPAELVVPVTTPFEALLLTLSSINEEIRDAREHFHNTSNSDRLRLFQKEIERLERDRKEILRILGEQNARGQNEPCSSQAPKE